MRMDEILKAAGDAAITAKQRVAVGGLGRYRKFTRKVRDFFALAAITQERLDLASAEMDAALASQMHTAQERLHARMVVMFVEESELFFATFVRVRALPIGSFEICGVELRGLQEIRRFLDNPLYDGEHGQALRQRADRVAQLMRKTMQRMPPLPDYGDLPSIGPRGTRNKPIRPPRRPENKPAATTAPVASPSTPEKPVPEAPPAPVPDAPGLSVAAPGNRPDEVWELTLEMLDKATSTPEQQGTRSGLMPEGKPPEP